MVREIVVIWQPVQLEREIITSARAWVMEHLSSSHRNESHEPAGSHFLYHFISTGLCSDCLRTVEKSYLCSEFPVSHNLSSGPQGYITCVRCDKK